MGDTVGTDCALSMVEMAKLVGMVEGIQELDIVDMKTVSLLVMEAEAFGTDACPATSGAMEAAKAMRDTAMGLVEKYGSDSIAEVPHAERAVLHEKGDALFKAITSDLTQEPAGPAPEAPVESV